MQVETHRQLLKELYKDIQHSFTVYFHKLRTERLLYKQRKNK